MLVTIEDCDEVIESGLENSIQPEVTKSQPAVTKSFTSTWANEVADKLKAAANTITDGKRTAKYKCVQEIANAARRKDEEKLLAGGIAKMTKKVRNKGMKALRRWFRDK